MTSNKRTIKIIVGSVCAATVVGAGVGIGVGYAVWKSDSIYTVSSSTPYLQFDANGHSTATLSTKLHKKDAKKVSYKIFGDISDAVMQGGVGGNMITIKDKMIPYNYDINVIASVEGKGEVGSCHITIIPQPIEDFNVYCEDPNLEYNDGKNVSITWFANNFTPISISLADDSDSSKFNLSGGGNPGPILNELSLSRISPTLEKGLYHVYFVATDDSGATRTAWTPITIHGPDERNLFLRSGDTKIQVGSLQNIYGSISASNFTLAPDNNLQVVDLSKPQNPVIPGWSVKHPSFGQTMIEIQHPALNQEGSLNIGIKDTVSNVTSNGLLVTVVTAVLVDNNKYLQINTDGTKLVNDVTTNMQIPSSQKIAKLYFGQTTIVNSLSCASNQIQELDVSRLGSSLTSLQCSINQLTQLDVSANTGLTFLDCSSNSLEDIDISHNVSLQTFYCRVNSIDELDISNNVLLQELYCYQNNLTEIDAQTNLLLTKLWCDANPNLTNVLLPRYSDGATHQIDMWQQGGPWAPHGTIYRVDENTTVINKPSTFDYAFYT